MEIYNYCNGCKKSLLISNFDKKSDNENYFTRCKPCREVFNKKQRERYIKKSTKIISFEKSFASFKGKTKNENLKIDCWDLIKNNNLTPSNIYKGTNKKYWFKCDDKNCNHFFNLCIKSITKKNNGSWCHFCAKYNGKLCDDKECIQCFNNSFASFKGKTKNENLKIDCWDLIKNNNLTLRNIFKSTRKKYWFKCDEKNCEHSFISNIANITILNNWCPFCANKQLCNDKEDCNQCFNKSFASFKEVTKNGNLKIDCWDKVKNNNILPQNIFKSTGKKYWFKCDDKNCGHSFNSNIKNITNNGSWCSYCCIPAQKLCNINNCLVCFNKTFASFKGKTKNGSFKKDCWDLKKNNNLTPINFFKGTNKKFWFKCDEKKCEHSFIISLNNITSLNNHWCPFCNNKILCDNKKCISCFDKSFASFKDTVNNKLKIDCFNIKKNEITPRELFKSSDKKYIFDCNVCNHSFTTRLSDITRKYRFIWCPHCKNKTELKLYNWLLKLDFITNIEREFSPIWCSTKYIFLKNKKIENGKYQYRYDFLLVFKNGKKLIIELYGCQHFVQVWNWKPPLLQQLRDKYKEKKAKQKGIKLITCIQEDVYNNKNNWDTKLLKILKQFI